MARQFPYRFISDLPQRAQQEIWRNFQTIANAATFPIIIVAADGSGDFDTLQAAVDFLNTTPGMIWVKSLNDGSTTIITMPAGSNIILTGNPGVPNASNQPTSQAVVIGGITGGDSVSWLTFFNIVVQAGNAGFFNDYLGDTIRWVQSQFWGTYLMDGKATSNNHLVLRESIINNTLYQAGTAVFTNLDAEDSYIGCVWEGINFGTTSCPNPVVRLKRCDGRLSASVNTTWLGYTNAVTGGNNGCVVLQITECESMTSGTMNVAMLGGGGGGNHGGAYVDISRNKTLTGAWTIIGATSGYALALNVSDNGETPITALSQSRNNYASPSAFTFDGTATQGEVRIANNFWSGTVLTVGDSATDRHHARISGHYKQLVLNLSSAFVDVVLNPDQGNNPGFSGTMLTVGGNKNLIFVAFSPNGSADKAYALTGNDNIIIANGHTNANYSVASTDAGTNNLFNSLPPSGAAGGDLTGTYPSPTLVAFGPGVLTKGSATRSVVMTTDAKGRVSALSDVAISGAGIDTTAVHTGDAAGGSLGGTYVNPIFAGRDSSVDKLNMDMVPSWLALVGGMVTIPVPAPGSAPTGPAGGSLNGTYPNPVFAGRDTSVDELNKDMTQPLIAAVASGTSVFPATATEDRRKDLVPALLVP